MNSNKKIFTTILITLSLICILTLQQVNSEVISEAEFPTKCPQLKKCADDLNNSDLTDAIRENHETDATGDCKPKPKADITSEMYTKIQSGMVGSVVENVNKEFAASAELASDTSALATDLNANLDKNLGEASSGQAQETAKLTQQVISAKNENVFSKCMFGSEQDIARTPPSFNNADDATLIAIGRQAQNLDNAKDETNQLAEENTNGMVNAIKNDKNFQNTDANNENVQKRQQKQKEFVEVKKKDKESVSKVNSDLGLPEIYNNGCLADKIEREIKTRCKPANDSAVTDTTTATNECLNDTAKKDELQKGIIMAVDKLKKYSISGDLATNDDIQKACELEMNANEAFKDFKPEDMSRVVGEIEKGNANSIDNEVRVKQQEKQIKKTEGEVNPTEFKQKADTFRQDIDKFIDEAKNGSTDLKNASKDLLEEQLNKVRKNTDMITEEGAQLSKQTALLKEVGNNKDVGQEFFKDLLKDTSNVKLNDKGELDSDEVKNLKEKTKQQVEGIKEFGKDFSLNGNNNNQQGEQMMGEQQMMGGNTQPDQQMNNQQGGQQMTGTMGDNTQQMTGMMSGTMNTGDLSQQAKDTVNNLQMNLGQNLDDALKNSSLNTPDGANQLADQLKNAAGSLSGDLQQAFQQGGNTDGQQQMMMGGQQQMNTSGTQQMMTGGQQQMMTGGQQQMMSPGGLRRNLQNNTELTEADLQILADDTCPISTSYPAEHVPKVEELANLVSNLSNSSTETGMIALSSMLDDFVCNADDTSRVRFKCRILNRLGNYKEKAFTHFENMTNNSPASKDWYLNINLNNAVDSDTPTSNQAGLNFKNSDKYDIFNVYLFTLNNGFYGIYFRIQRKDKTIKSGLIYNNINLGLSRMRHNVSCLEGSENQTGGDVCPSGLVSPDLEKGFKKLSETVKKASPDNKKKCVFNPCKVEETNNNTENDNNAKECGKKVVQENGLDSSKIVSALTKEEEVTRLRMLQFQESFSDADIGNTDSNISIANSTPNNKASAEAGLNYLVVENVIQESNRSIEAVVSGNSETMIKISMMLVLLIGLLL